MRIRVKWQVNDGYAGKSRPQETLFESRDYTETDWEKLPHNEKEDIIDQAVQEDFEQKITYSIYNYEEG
ncbi:MAG: hypothetical protein ACTSYY_12850 [Promethearchaeota archaeon]